MNFKTLGATICYGHCGKWWPHCNGRCCSHCIMLADAMPWICGRCYHLACVIAIGGRWNSHMRVDFILSSEVLNRTSSHMCGRCYLPMFLFRDGLLTLMYNASFIVLMRFWFSPPLWWNFLLWWYELWCYRGHVLGKGPPGVLWTSPQMPLRTAMHSPLHSTQSHLYLYTTLPSLVMGFLSLRAIRKLLMVWLPLKCNHFLVLGIPCLQHTFLRLSIMC